LASRRVVFFDAYPHDFAGAQRATLLLMQGLAGNGWRVELAVPADGPFVTVARDAGFDVTILAIPSALRVYGRRTTGWRLVGALLTLPLTWLRLARWFRARADIVHISDHRGQVLVGPAARLARRPVVWHVHAISGNRLLNMGCALLARRVIVPTRAAADESVGVEWRRPAVVVPNALGLQFFEPAERHPTSPPLLLSIGRVYPDKGFDVLVQATAILRAAIPDICVEVVGPSQEAWADHERDLLELRGALGLDQVVTFPGYLADPIPRLLDATVYVQPSRTESQGVALLEAMALGIPVIASRAGGVPETLGDGAYGVLVPPGDAEALATALAHVLREPDEAAARAAAAHAHVHETCTPERMVAGVEQLYADL
jgi:glycosyltransferase involved in cell wall biosynthesis